MRLIKENTMQYESLFSRLNNGGRITGIANHFPAGSMNFQDSLPKETTSAGFTNYISKLHEFENEIRMCDTPALVSSFRDKVSTLNFCKDFSFYITDKESKLKLEFTSRKDRTGVVPGFLPDIQEIFRDGRIKLFKSIPSGNKIIIPLLDGTSRRGILCIDTQISQLNYNSPDFYFLSVLSGLFQAQYNLIQKKKELIGSVKDAQHYQSKLLKDFRLAALGELTIGVSQEILSSLQIILTSINLLENGNVKKTPRISLSELANVKNHVAKIDKLLKNVIKFSDIGKENKFPLKPSSLNETLEEFIELFRPSFQNNNYEIVTDLEPDLPTVISSGIYLKQILISVFSLLKSPLPSGGGYLVRTKHDRERVHLIILSTDPIKLDEHPENIDLKMLKNLITMHEGGIEISSEAGKGAAVILNFPIKREI